MKMPSIPHGSGPSTIAALIEAVEILAGRRGNTSIDYGKIDGETVPEFDLYALGELVSNLGRKNTHYARLGYLERPKFSWVDADTITIGPGVYHHKGTTDQFVEWDSGITLDVSVAGTQFYYLYVSDEQIRRHGKSVLSADDFTLSTTAPTYKGSAHAWMNGLDRCIMGYHVTGGSLDNFTHDGGDYVQYSAQCTDRALADLDARAAVTLTIPAYSQKALCYFRASLNVEGRMVCVSPSDTDGPPILWTNGLTYSDIVLPVITSSSQSIYIALTSYGGTDNVTEDTLGWFFPAGM